MKRWGGVRYAGARGQLTVRADSGFYTHAVVAVCRRMDVRFSIAIRQRARLHNLIEAIPEDAWTPIPYWMDGPFDPPLRGQLGEAGRMVPPLWSGCGIRPWYHWMASVPDREGITGHFGPGSLSYQRDIAALKTLYQENAELETIRVKRRLWYDLLRTALGEIAYSPEGMSDEARAALEKVGTEEMDDLFVRHTYVGTVIGMVVQASVDRQR